MYFTTVLIIATCWITPIPCVTWVWGTFLQLTGLLACWISCRPLSWSHSWLNTLDQFMCWWCSDWSKVWGNEPGIVSLFGYLSDNWLVVLKTSINHWGLQVCYVMICLGLLEWDWEPGISPLVEASSKPKKQTLILKCGNKDWWNTIIVLCHVHAQGTKAQPPEGPYSNPKSNISF